MVMGQTKIKALSSLISEDLIVAAPTADQIEHHSFGRENLLLGLVPFLLNRCSSFSQKLLHVY